MTLGKKYVLIKINRFDRVQFGYNTDTQYNTDAQYNTDTQYNTAIKKEQFIFYLFITIGTLIV